MRQFGLSHLPKQMQLKVFVVKDGIVKFERIGRIPNPCGGFTRLQVVECMNEVKSKIQSMRTENLEGEVVIQADKQAKAGLVLQVIDFAKSSGAKVSVATEKVQ